MRSVRSFLAKVVVVGAMSILAAAAGAVSPGAGGKTQTLAELQAKFDHEENAVRKAKLIEKLGDAQFEALHAAEKAEDYSAVGLTLEKYRDNVDAALAGLKKEHPDAERQSNGYRQLQMHLRRGIREVREALVTSPEEFRPPLELVEKDLTGMDDELLRMLFPSPTAGKPAKKEVKP
ncbi:MAG: hypothetical protein ABSG69_04925 [Candidatus Acidiferrum sp.]|jgi:hypothetical protein